MRKTPRARHFRLSEGAGGTVRRFISGGVQLAEGKGSSWVTVTRTGSFTDPRYGRFEISRPMLEEMVRNFDSDAYGQLIFIDQAHEPTKGAAGTVKRLSIEGDRLRALVEWTDWGRELIEKKGFRYLSAEFHENWKDNEKGDPHGCVLLGAGLVTRPCIKRLDPVTLSETGSDAAIAVHPTLLTELIREIEAMKEKYLKQLRERLAAFKLSENVIEQMVTALGKMLDGVTDESGAAKLCEGMETTAKALAEQVGDKPVSVTLQVAGGGAAGVSADDVRRILAEQAEATRKLAEDATAKRRLFAEHLAEVGKALSEDTRRELAEAVADLIGADTPDAMVRALAEKNAALAGKFEATRQLAAMGWTPSGSVHIDVPNETPKKLAGMIHEALKRTDAYARGDFTLPEKDTHFVGKVLAAFDARHGYRLDAEHKALAGGQAAVGDYFFPAGLQREVIRVALSDLRILDLVRTGVDPTAQGSTQIPYEVRPEYGAVNDGVVFEGQPIPRYQTTTAHELAFITPMKIGMEWTNELQHFTQRGRVNWDAVAENLAANARTMRELIARRIANEMQRAADSYLAVAVSGEDIASQLDGGTSIVKTAGFPVVRPFQARDMQGNAQGAEQNAVAVVVNTVTIARWDGSGTQAAGTYWRPVSFNLGYFQLVDEAGDPVTPTAATACTIGYSRATNVVKVDLDVPGGATLEQHLNGLLRAVGARKALLSGQRFVQPEYLLMSSTLNDTATNAEAFVASMKRNGADTSATGDLETIKGVPAFGTNQPGIDLGDERILMGPRNLLAYTISKPFAVEGQPFEVVDANGKAVGKKQVYGEEYNAIHVPTQVRQYMTSVLAYSASNR